MGLYLYQNTQFAVAGIDYTRQGILYAKFPNL